MRIHKNIIMLIVLVILSVFLGGINIVNAEESVFMEYDDYYTFGESVTISSQSVSSEGESLGDTQVIEITEGTSGKIHAVGLGSAVVLAGGTTYNITVSKADIAIVMIAGQSNAAGDSSSYAMAPKAVGDYEGKFYITNSMNSSLPVESISFESATYAAKNGGREQTLTNSAFDTWSAAAASSLARKLNDLWDMKIWVVNTAVCGSAMNVWKDGGGYNTNFISYANRVKSLVEADGHYINHTDKFGYLWLQGCSDGINYGDMSMSNYISAFMSMHNKFKTATGVNYAAIWQVRAGVYNNNPAEDFYMSGPRLAQYYMGNSNTTEYSDVHLLLNTDIWRIDADVKSYFLNKYGTAENFEKLYGYAIPETASDIKPNLHYNQKGYNELGDEGAVNLNNILNGTKSVTSAKLYDYYGNEFETVMVDGITDRIALPVVTSNNYNGSAGIKMVIEDEAIAQVNNDTYCIKGIKSGETKLNIMYGDTAIAAYPLVSEVENKKTIDLSSDFFIDFTSAYAQDYVKDTDINFSNCTYTEKGILTGNSSVANYNLNIPSRAGGKYIIETTINLQDNKGMQFGMFGAKQVQRIYVDGTKLYSHGESAPVEIGKVSLNEDITYRCIVDFDNNNFRVFVNGTEIALSYPYLRSGGTEITTLQWCSFANTKMYIKDVSVYKMKSAGDSINVDLTTDTAELQAFESGLSIGTSAEFTENGVKITGTSGMKLTIPKKTAGKYAFEADYLYEFGEGIQTLFSGDKYIEKIYVTSNGRFYVSHENGAIAETKYKITPGKPFTVKLILDLDTRDFKAYLDGKPIEIPCNYLMNLSDLPNLDLIEWRGFSGGCYYVEGVRFYEVKEDYVQITAQTSPAGSINLPTFKLLPGDTVDISVNMSSGYTFDMLENTVPDALKDRFSTSATYTAISDDIITLKGAQSTLIKKGDVNYDGKIDVFDVVSVLETVSEVNELGNVGKQCSDVNENGTVDISDATKIIKYVARTINSFDTTEDEPTDNGPKKYVTLSFDDGITQDARLIEILNKYGIKCTFNISSGLYGKDSSASVSQATGKQVSHVRLNKEQVAAGYYDGHEVASHTLKHAVLKNMTDDAVIEDINADVANLTNTLGYAPKGLAYPNGDAYVSEENIVAIASGTNMCYGRMTGVTGTFALPAQFLKWKATANVTNMTNVMNLAKTFAETPIGEEDMLFYLWGHTYELDLMESWDEFEAFCAYISSYDDIVFVTNGEFYELFKNEIPRY